MESIFSNYPEIKDEKFYNQLKELISIKRQQLFSKDRKFVFFNQLIRQLPEIKVSASDLVSDCIKIFSDEKIEESREKIIYEVLKQLMPWRTGPYNFFSAEIDTEWCSYIKFNKIKRYLTSLQDKRILDIGSNSGYYMFKCAEFNPLFVLGLEPYSNYYFQYTAVQYYLKLKNIFCIPARFEELPSMNGFFDKILCMGVLYHSRMPLNMLKKISDCLNREGDLILETLIIDGEEEVSLTPADRYAKMNNVYFIPTINCLKNWLLKAGFHNISCIDVTDTSVNEQRKTNWINSESLSDFLDKNNSKVTVEGYPAPKRAIFTANARKH